MPTSLQIVSGLRDGSPGLVALCSSLAGAGLECTPVPLRTDDVGRTMATGGHLLVVLPILGDNDLTDDLRALVRGFIDIGACEGCAVSVLLAGDRHVSDDVLPVDAPVIVKLSHLFRRRGAFRIERRKLDADTAPDIAASIIRCHATTKASDIEALDALTRLLGRRPGWLPEERLLDLYCTHSGFSLLHERSAGIVRGAATLVSRIAPEALLLRGAGLRDATLEGIAPALGVPRIDLGSNSLGVAGIASHLSACRWLGLGANAISEADLAVLPATVETIHLQKNLLEDISLRGRRANQFKAISLYRNCLSRIEWPSEQRAIIRLNLGANPIERLPDGLAQADRLESLGLARTRLARLPEWLFDLPRLREVDISYMEDVLPAPQLAALRCRGVTLVTRPGYKDAT